MAFPTNPTNGQQANVNGVVYTYNSTKGVWAVTTTFTGNVLVNQINANAVVSAGNVSGTNFNGTTVSMTGSITGGTMSVTGGNLTITGFALPSATGTYDLGSTTARWRNIYTNDLQLNNGIGDYTVVEGEEDLFLYNNKQGKVYKFALIEVDPTTAPPKAKTD